MMRKQSSDLRPGAVICPIRALFGNDAGERDRGARRRNEILPVAGGGRGSRLAVVPEIDHRIGESLERVVQPTDAFEAKQQPAELVLPSKYPLDRAEALLEDGRLEDRLAAPLGLLSAARVGVDVGNHAAVEDRFAVDPAVVDTIKTDDGAAEVSAHPSLFGVARDNPLAF